VTERVFTSAGIRAIDAELARLDLLELTMEHAGARVAAALHARAPRGRILVLAGRGANGGDALVAARHLQALGRGVTVLALTSRHDLTRRMHGRLAHLLPVTPLTPGALSDALRDADVVLDGLLGTGFVPPLRDDVAELVRCVNAWHHRSRGVTFSIDVPSGLPSDTVEHGDAAVLADVTLALVGPKPALLFGDVGDVTTLNLGVPRHVLDRHAAATLTGDGDVAALLPRRTRGAHKGTAGRIWVLGGTPGYAGAPAMTALGALRAGAGLVSVYSRTDVPHHFPEVMPHRVNDWADLPARERPDAVAVGMGLREEGSAVARAVLSWEVPTVVDADALQRDVRGAGHEHVVWTPHPGEAARMLGASVADVTRDPLSAARELQRAYGGTVVLKGGPTTVATPHETRVCPRGNPGMGTGGMGDVLSGVIAALLGQGLPGPEAAVAGVHLHALAGDLAYARLGYGLVATDVAHEIARAWVALVGNASGGAFGSVPPSRVSFTDHLD